MPLYRNSQSRQPNSPLLVFDYVVPGSNEHYHARKAKLTEALQVHQAGEPPDSNQIYAIVASAQTMADALELYQALQQLNRYWRCPFYEGVVAKRADLSYPVQLRSAICEFSGWEGTLDGQTAMPSAPLHQHGAVLGESTLS